MMINDKLIIKIININKTKKVKTNLTHYQAYTYQMIQLMIITAKILARKSKNQAIRKKKN